MSGSLTEIAMPARSVLAALLVCSMVVGNPARAADSGTWPVHGKLVGKNGKKSEDISGIACATPRGIPLRLRSGWDEDLGAVEKEIASAPDREKFASRLPRGSARPIFRSSSVLC